MNLEHLQAEFAQVGAASRPQMRLVAASAELVRLHTRRIQLAADEAPGRLLVRPGPPTNRLTLTVDVANKYEVRSFSD